MRVDLNELQPTEEPGLMRDPATGALLNTNSEAWKQYRQVRAAQQSTMAIEQRVERLEQSLEHTVSLLNNIIDLLKK